jgi:hypothetical protein
MNKFGNIFGQILQIVSRSEFYRDVKETKAEKGAKGFMYRQQFVGMLFCQLGQAHSLREICGGLASCLGKIKHLGIHESPNRSTLSYANEHRPWQLAMLRYDFLAYRDLGAWIDNTFEAPPFEKETEQLTLVGICLGQHATRKEEPPLKISLRPSETLVRCGVNV